jgi:pyruvate kinase
VLDIDGSPDLTALEARVRALRDALLAAEVARANEIAATHPSHRRSAANLVHYVELRNHDIRELQRLLGLMGLSSLGRSEPYVLATIEAVLRVLASMTNAAQPERRAGVALTEGIDLLALNADRLLGPADSGRSTRIMVTIPREAADDDRLIGQWLADGMDLARINCAHDDEDVWARMIARLRSHSAAGGLMCQIAMDLGGPKLRTGPLMAGPRAIRIRPRRDDCGRVVTPGRIRLYAAGAMSAETRPVRDDDMVVVGLPVDDPTWLERRQPGDRIELLDSRGARRHWEVTEVGPGSCLASTTQTTYVVTGLEIACKRTDGHDLVTVGELPETEQSHRVHRGDSVVLTRSLDPAVPTQGGTRHFIGCTLPAVFNCAQVGERVWIDDGKIGGVIHQVADDQVELIVTDIRPGGANLKAGKGINLPDTDLHLDALTSTDLADLPFVAQHADIVSLSFVRRPGDVKELQHHLEQLGATSIGIVLKIENVAAFENLPELLLTAMRSPCVGVMIARGDLAVEVGFDRLAEVQEQIMWACEAAHVPVIWATEVLDRLARVGQPSRAEVTDAAMSQRAECVMLNKGPYISEAIGALDSILTRMHDHQDKKRSLLRRLRAWEPTTHGLPDAVLAALQPADTPPRVAPPLADWVPRDRESGVVL